jgi:pimeloyl-ACP methyl ester carboxylesterase
MDRFASYDGTDIAYRRLGRGRPLVCLPGGPGLSPDYLGNVGGLGEKRTLILPETRGTASSGIPADPATYRCDRMVADVEALRTHLGLERMDLVGHSAAADLAVLCAAAHPERLDHLILLNPVTFALGLALTKEELLASMERRRDEPWYPAARKAVLAAGKGADTTEMRRAYAPLFYGRWDDAAQAHAALEFERRVPAVEAGYYAEGAFSPDTTRAAVAKVGAPVLVYAGGLDVNPTSELAERAARLFPRGQVVVQPGAGHFPWLDDPGWFRSVMTFLG